MSDVHALVGAYAVDAVDDVERAAFERHLAECEACRAELAGLREAAALMAEVEPLDPPDRLRDQVLAGIGSIRPLPPPPEPEEQPATPTQQRRFRPRALLAAAAAVVVLGVGTPIVWQQVTDDSSTTVTESPEERVLNASDAEEYTQSLDGVEVTVVRSRSLNEAVLVTDAMPDPPPGKVYELWLAHEGQGMVPAGLMGGGAQQVLLEGDPADAMGAGITVEPEGGSDKPTSEPMMSFTFKRA